MITIINYNAGNIRSVERACAEIGIKSIVTDGPEKILNAEKIIFPGVGAAPSAMEYLLKKGIDNALRKAFEKGTPILGICIGTQIILDYSEEGDQKCIGLIPGKTVRFKPKDRSLKIPHMGWNELNILKPHPLLEGIKPGNEFYFVHSYYPDPDDEYKCALTNHGIDFCSALGKDSLFATQFHPEKSGRIGLDFLSRFSRWDGKI